MADSPPTKEGQNIIIKNLSSIFMTLMGLLLAYLFSWGKDLSTRLATDDILFQTYKDEITRLEAKVDGQQKGLLNKIQDNANDIDDLKNDAEKVHDDLKTRIIHQEDWSKAWEQYHKK